MTRLARSLYVDRLASKLHTSYTNDEDNDFLYSRFGVFYIFRSVQTARDIFTTNQERYE
jgi:hypothetical protein